MMRVLHRNPGVQGIPAERTMPSAHTEAEFYTELDAMQDKTPVRTPSRARSVAHPIKSATLLTTVWALAIVFFGFGDTLTSMMVFGSGGVEGNGFMVLALTLLSKMFGSIQAIVGFAIIKIVSTGAIVVTAQAQPKLLWPAGIAMLATGIFLTAQNTTVLMAL